MDKDSVLYLLMDMQVNGILDRIMDTRTRYGLNAPFCEEASAQVFRTRYQLSVSAGAEGAAPP